MSRLTRSPTPARPRPKAITTPASAPRPRPNSVAIPMNLAPDYATGGAFHAGERPRFFTAAGRFFLPNGPTMLDERTRPILGARLLVGFKVGPRAVWDVDTVAKIVGRLRADQGRAPDSTFIAQTGMYRHADGTGTVLEKGVQVLILQTGAPTTKAAFAKEIREVALHLRAILMQEAVLVEVQRNGIVYGWEMVQGLGPDEPSPEYLRQLARKGLARPRRRAG
jgi:hypothetical protein